MGWWEGSGWWGGMLGDPDPMYLGPEEGYSRRQRPGHDSALTVSCNSGTAGPAGEPRARAGLRVSSPPGMREAVIPRPDISNWREFPFLPLGPNRVTPKYGADPKGDMP